MTLVAIPAAATLLEQVDPHPRDDVAVDVSRLRTAVDVLDLTAADVVALVVQGPLGVTVAGQADLTGYGCPHVRTALRPANVQAGDLARRLGVEVTVADVLDGEVGVLALQVAARTGAAVVAVSTDDAPRTVDAVVQALREVATSASLAVVVAGDLAATLTTRSPGHLVADAEDWDHRALTAIEELDVDALRALGPDDAERVVAHGWVPLLVATKLARDLAAGVPHVVYAAPHGVGYVVARFT